MTSTTITRRWASAVEWRRSRHSVAKETAVSKPKVITVFERSLSMVLGTPTMRTPFFARALAMVREPSPPMATTASISWAARARTRSSVRSSSFMVPSGIRVGYLRGFPRLVVPMMVPPRWVIPRTRVRLRGTRPPSG